MRVDRQAFWCRVAWLCASGPLFTLIFGYGLVFRLRQFDPEWTPNSHGLKIPDQDLWMNAFAALVSISILAYCLVLISVVHSISQWRRLSWLQRIGPVCLFVGLLAVLIFVDQLALTAFVWHLD